jgi:hypothetical protein
MIRIKRLLAGGSAGNQQLTAVMAILLLLLAIEEATLLQLRSLLTVHAFVGMLLIPPVALKLASTGWRMLRYYLGGEEYVRRGPPQVVLRVLVAPLIVLSSSCCSELVSRCSPSARQAGRLSVCTRRASSSGSAPPVCTCWATP